MPDITPMHLKLQQLKISNEASYEPSSPKSLLAESPLGRNESAFGLSTKKANRIDEPITLERLSLHTMKSNI